jgi:AraC-like DNA-binding protein
MQWFNRFYMAKRKITDFITQLFFVIGNLLLLYCCLTIRQRGKYINTCPIMTQQQPFKRLAHEAAIAIKMAIDTDPLKRLPIQEISNDIQIGRNRLQLAFRLMTGMTIKRYRLQKRMELARDMLATRGSNIKQVAFRCGYKNQSNFSTDYKLVFEIAPLDFIKNCNPPGS